MLFQETKLKGAFLVDLDKKIDQRGFFARAYCAREFSERGLSSTMVQANLSFNEKRGTVRGMHYAMAPASEPKFVRCVRGAIWDVIVDLRPGSPTYLQHVAFELSAENRLAIYIPDMFAHGNQTLVDGSELLYLMGEFYAAGQERGLRYNDPVLGIPWPLPVTVVSEKDATWPLLQDARD